MSICNSVTRRFSLVFILAATGSCTRPSTLPEPQSSPVIPETPEPVVPSPAKGNTTKLWQLSPTTEPQRYTTFISTIVQQQSVTPPVSDSVKTTTRYSIGVMRSPNSASITGIIESFEIKAGNRIGSDTIEASFPASFNGQIRNHELSLDLANSRSNSSSALSCQSTEKNALTTIQRNLYTIPFQLQNGMTWQDSLSSTSCSGPLELTLTTIRNYKVIGETTFNAVPAILVAITEKTLSEGEGSQDQHRVMITSEAQKSGNMYLDEVTGTLLNVISETHTTIQIQTSGRTQQFLQTSRETTTRM